MANGRHYDAFIPPIGRRLARVVYMNDRTHPRILPIPPPFDPSKILTVVPASRHNRHPSPPRPKPKVRSTVQLLTPTQPPSTSRASKKTKTYKSDRDTGGSSSAADEYGSPTAPLPRLLVTSGPGDRSVKHVGTDNPAFIPTKSNEPN